MVFIYFCLNISQSDYWQSWFGGGGGGEGEGGGTGLPAQERQGGVDRGTSFLDPTSLFSSSDPPSNSPDYGYGGGGSGYGGGGSGGYGAATASAYRESEDEAKAAASRHRKLLDAR